jgi:hypothetical protein
MGLLLFFFLAHQIRERVDPFREFCHSVGVWLLIDLQHAPGRE